MGDKLKITKRTIKGYDFIDISGNIMLEGSKEIMKFVKKTIGGKDKDIYLNFDGVNYVNSSALSMILQLVRDLSSKKVNIFLMNVNEKILSLIKIAGLHNYFKFVSDEAALIERIDKEDTN
jgi:anti-anti-sigma factor